MNYFRINNSVGSDVGYYPQVFQADLNFHIEDKNSATKLFFSEAGSKTLWPVPKLSGKAKKTDLVSVSFMGLSDKLIISPHLHGILATAKSKGIQFIQSKLITKNGNEEYWIVNPHWSDYSFMDVEKSDFVYTDRMLNNEFEHVNFKSIDDFIKAYQKNQLDSIQKSFDEHHPLIIKKIAFKEDCLIDFFPVLGISGGIHYFVSHTLKNRIVEEKCTGVIFEEIN